MNGERPRADQAKVLGIDIGGSGIKGALVDVECGALIGERHRIPTPRPAKPEPIARVVAELVEHFEWSGAVGCTFPGVIKEGTVLTAANIHKSWVDLDGLYGRYGLYGQHGQHGPV